MYRKPEDFLEDWAMSADGTLAVMKAITDDKMDVAIVEGHNSLGWLAWHLVSAAGFFGQFAGLQVPAPGKDTPMPDNMAAIIAKYEEVVEAYKNEADNLTEEKLTAEMDGFQGPVARGKFLRMLIDHQTHHRGQMTVLLRQAGLPVPGIMGPTKEMS
ncbi:DinB family protein [Paenibacillus sp. GCM10027626]|uniref:DinB family protein n=1 Tax=Paenibacillus sp. GCM10027626 TaxID=3273411 RepID=UPI003645872F